VHDAPNAETERIDFSHQQWFIVRWRPFQETDKSAEEKIQANMSRKDISIWKPEGTRRSLKFPERFWAGSRQTRSVIPSSVVVDVNLSKMYSAHFAGNTLACSVTRNPDFHHRRCAYITRLINMENGGIAIITHYVIDTVRPGTNMKSAGTRARMTKLPPQIPRR